MLVTVHTAICLLDVRDMGGFYFQTWYEKHAFARHKLRPGRYTVGHWQRELVEPGPSAVLCALAWSQDPTLWWDTYVWTSDYDDFHNPVYVGMTGGDLHATPGFQVHRLLIPDQRWGFVCVGSS